MGIILTLCKEMEWKLSMQPPPHAHTQTLHPKTPLGPPVRTNQGVG